MPEIHCFQSEVDSMYAILCMDVDVNDLAKLGNRPGRIMFVGSRQMSEQALLEYSPK